MKIQTKKVFLSSFPFNKVFKEGAIMRTCILFLAFFLCTSMEALAANPTLFFSDIISGPKSGLGDGLGQGAIVTIWGYMLGGSQSQSKVMIRDSANNTFEAAHVYYWVNADGAGGGGPADLYSSHKMQEIAFSLPSSLADGNAKIYVTVSGVPSNELDFVVRPGNIYYVKTTGTDGSAGSWGNPWLTMNWALSSSPVKAGDIVYVGKGVSTTESVIIGRWGERDGAPANRIALIAYPGADVKIDLTNGGVGIGNYNSANDYWVISKFDVITNGTGINGFSQGRIIANAITDPGYLDADGQGGGIDAGANWYADGGKEGISGLKVFGNYIHDFGGPTTTNKHHTTYFRLRSVCNLPAPEIAWNHFSNNEARGGIHYYDEGQCGNFTGTYKIHDNYIKDQIGPGIDIVTGCASGFTFKADVDIQNNYLENTGLLPYAGAGNFAVVFQGPTNLANINFTGNYIIGYGDPKLAGSVGAWVASSGTLSFAGTYVWKNNIMVDTKNLPFFPPSSKAPTEASGNVWNTGGDGIPASPPEWANSSISNEDPRLLNIGFYPQPQLLNFLQPPVITNIGVSP